MQAGAVGPGDDLHRALLGPVLDRDVALGKQASELDERLAGDDDVDPAVLEAVTVQSGLDLSTFDPRASAAWAAVGQQDASTWATAVGLSLYEHELPRAKEVA